MKKPLIVIAGPTASGKTAMSIEFAKKNNGEIVNADSMQVYKYMDIGTAKPIMEERQGIPHYLMDEIEPTVQYSVAQYCNDARKYISQIHQKGKVPILVGGTGLYIDSVVYNIRFAEGGADEAFRKELEQLAADKGNNYIYEMLEKIDPQSAQRIHPSDRKRVIRALEIYHVTGKTITEQNKNSRRQSAVYDTEIYAIDIEREELYRRINERVDKMFEAGLIDEVKHLMDMGVNKSMTSVQGIGYKEVIDYLNGEYTLEETKNLIKQSTRRYAKRQLTWFRKNADIIWIRR